MRSAIKIGNNYGTFNFSRINKIINSETKEQALKMGWLDKFKELFRGNNKKIPRIEALWNAIHLSGESSATGPTGDQTFTGLIPGTALYKIHAFANLKQIVNTDNNAQSSCNFAITNNSNAVLDFKINEEIIAKVETSAIECKYDIYIKKQDIDPHEFLLSAQLSLINLNLQEEERYDLEEIQKHVNNSQSSTFEETTLVNKSANDRAYIIYKDSQTGKKCVLIKPRIKNAEKRKVQAGGYKTVKPSALRIVLGNDNQIESIQRYVTCSELRPAESDPTKTKDNDKLKQKDLSTGGWEKLTFQDNKTNKQRTIFIMPYKGTNLASVDYLQFNKIQIAGIIKQLMQKFNSEIFDIKLENTLLDYHFNGNEFEIAVDFIDHTDNNFTFSPQSTTYNSLTAIQFFCLAFMFYSICELNCTTSITQQQNNNDQKKHINELITYFQNQNHNGQMPKLTEKNPFASLLEDTYNCTSSLNESSFRTSVSTILTSIEKTAAAADRIPASAISA